MAHAQKPVFVFRRNGRVRLNRLGRQLSQLLATEVCASAVVMLDTPCSVLVWRLLTAHSIRKFPLHFPSRASPCAITFQLDCTNILFLGSCHFYSRIFALLWGIFKLTPRKKRRMTVLTSLPVFCPSSLWILATCGQNYVQFNVAHFYWKPWER
jgi:hypothetical protein